MKKEELTEVCATCAHWFTKDGERGYCTCLLDKSFITCAECSCERYNKAGGSAIKRNFL